MEPTPYFATRPEVPAVGTDDYNRWKKESTITFDGGYIRATYGNLIQTFAMTGSDACSAKAITYQRKAHQRTNTIGGDTREIEAVGVQFNKYPRRNSSGAAAGDLITITTSVGSYTARLGGDIQHFVEFLCSNSGKGQLYDPITFTSGRTAFYGPFGPANTSNV